MIKNFKKILVLILIPIIVTSICSHMVLAFYDLRENNTISKKYAQKNIEFGNAGQILYNNNTMYVFDVDNETLFAYNVNDPINPGPAINTSIFCLENNQFAIGKNHLYQAFNPYFNDKPAFCIYNLIDPFNPDLELVNLYSIEEPGFQEIYINQNYLLLTYFFNLKKRIDILSLNVPELPEYCGEIILNNTAEVIAYYNDYFYVWENNNYLRIYRFWDDWNISSVNALELSDGICTNIAFANNFLYASFSDIESPTGHFHGLVIINVTNPDTVKNVSYIPMEIGDASDMVIKNSHIYLAGHFTTLTDFEITSPGSIVQREKLTFPQYAAFNPSIDCNNENIVFISTSNLGVYIFDLTPPTMPASFNAGCIYITSFVIFSIFSIIKLKFRKNKG